MGLIWIVAAIFWGAAEATLFFIVPDVLLTTAVIRFGFRRTLPLAFIAAAFASLAGAAMWLWGNGDAANARQIMLLVPAIGPDLLARAHGEIASDWLVHLFTGAVTGLPYKLYAVEAGARGINPFLFVLVSFAARLPRFLLTMWLAVLGRAALSKIERPNWSYAAWALGWLVLYTFYFIARAAA
jgi:membrane protein YqaA with SNARE-associated domain